MPEPSESQALAKEFGLVLQRRVCTMTRDALTLALDPTSDPWYFARDARAAEWRASLRAGRDLVGHINAEAGVGWHPTRVKFLGVLPAPFGLPGVAFGRQMSQGVSRLMSLGSVLPGNLGVDTVYGAFEGAMADPANLKDTAALHRATENSIGAARLRADPSRSAQGAALKLENAAGAEARAWLTEAVAEYLYQAAGLVVAQIRDPDSGFDKQIAEAERRHDALHANQRKHVRVARRHVAQAAAGAFPRAGVLEAHGTMQPTHAMDRAGSPSWPTTGPGAGQRSLGQDKECGK